MTKIDLKTLLKLKENAKTIDIEDIIDILGINELKPIDGTESVKSAIDNTGDYFKEMYEENIRSKFIDFIDKAISSYND